MKALQQLRKRLYVYAKAVFFEYFIQMDQVEAKNERHPAHYIFKQWNFVSIGFNHRLFSHGVFKYDGTIVRTATILGIEFATGYLYERIYQFTPEEWASARESK